MIFMLHNSDMEMSTSQTSPPSRRSGGGGVQIPKVSRVTVGLQARGGVRVFHVGVPTTLSYSKCNAPLCALASSLCFLLAQIVVVRRTFDLNSLLTLVPFDEDAGLFGVNCDTRDGGGGGRRRGNLVKIQPITRHSSRASGTRIVARV